MQGLIKRNNNALPSLFDDVFGEGDSLFGDIFGNRFLSAPNPNVDILDQKDKIVIKADLPGLTKEDIKVSVEGGALVIEGERKQETSSEKDGVLRQEVTYGLFSRSFRLNSDVTSQDVKATYKDGVLTVEVPKKESKSSAIKIKVE